MEDLVYWIDDIVQPNGCIDAENRRAMDEAMAKYTEDFMGIDHKMVVDAGEPMPIKPPAGCTFPITHTPYTIVPTGNGVINSFRIHYNAPADL